MDDITLNPGKANGFSQERQREELVMEKPVENEMRSAMNMHAAAGVQCPKCGTVNDAETLRLLEPGLPLQNVDSFKSKCSVGQLP